MFFIRRQKLITKHIPGTSPLVSGCCKFFRSKITIGGIACPAALAHTSIVVCNLLPDVWDHTFFNFFGCYHIEWPSIKWHPAFVTIINLTWFVLQIMLIQHFFQKQKVILKRFTVGTVSTNTGICITFTKGQYWEAALESVKPPIAYMLLDRHSLLYRYFFDHLQYLSLSCHNPS